MMSMALRATKMFMAKANATRSSATVAKPKPKANPNPQGASTRGGALTRPVAVSTAMKKFLGVSEIPRTEAMKKIWDYVKTNNLQNPTNRREIVCDEKLKSIFGGKERVGMLEIPKLLNLHFIKNE